MKGHAHASDVDVDSAPVSDVDAAPSGSADRPGSAASDRGPAADLRDRDSVHAPKARGLAPAGTLLLTLEEVGTELRVSEDSVERLVKAGELKAVRIGAKGRLRVRRDDLVRFVAKMQTTAERGAEAWR